MLKDITLGQYFPGTSIIHRLDPRMKIIIAIIYITAIFVSARLYTLAIMFISTIIIIAISGIPFITVMKAIKPLMFLLIFTLFMNIFMVTDDNLLFSFFFIKIYLAGIRHAVFFLIRIISLVCATSILISYTTSPTALTDAIETLLSPLKKVKIPVHEFAMMMTIALRFIPTLLDETEKIMNAQKARGADFYSGNILKRAKALVPILIPLIVSAFRRAEELAVAMECRCYRGGEGRTKMKRLEYSPRDFIALFITAAFIAGIVILQQVT